MECLPVGDNTTKATEKTEDTRVFDGEFVSQIEELKCKCANLEGHCNQVEMTNRTLQREVDLLKSENTLMNSKILNIMSTINKMSCLQNATSDNTNNTSGKTSEKASAATVDKDPTRKDQSAEAPIPERLAALETCFQSISKLSSEREQRLNNLAGQLTSIDSKTDWLESELQRYVRRHSIIIENICPKEDRSASQIFLLFANSVLNVTIDESDIDSLHLIDKEVLAGKKTQQKTSSTPSQSPDKRPRPVLVTFTCYRARAQVYKAWLTFRSNATVQGTGGASLSSVRGQGLCIREFLTESQEKVYNEAVASREKKLIVDCWTFKGKTFIKTAEGDIREFISKEASGLKEERSGACSVM